MSFLCARSPVRAHTSHAFHAALTEPPPPPRPPQVPSFLARQLHLPHDTRTQTQRSCFRPRIALPPASKQAPVSARDHTPLATMAGGGGAGQKDGGSLPSSPSEPSPAPTATVRSWQWGLPPACTPNSPGLCSPPSSKAASPVVGVFIQQQPTPGTVSALVHPGCEDSMPQPTNDGHASLTVWRLQV